MKNMLSTADAGLARTAGSFGMSLRPTSLVFSPRVSTWNKQPKMPGIIAVEKMTGRMAKMLMSS